MESDLFYVGLKVQILRFFGPFRTTAGMLCRNHQRKNGKRPLAPFWSKSQLVLCLYNISHFSAGDSTLLRSGKRTNGRPPNHNFPSAEDLGKTWVWAPLCPGARLARLLESLQIDFLTRSSIFNGHTSATLCLYRPHTVL